jgi:hypothetical protein
METEFFSASSKEPKIGSNTFFFIYLTMILAGLSRLYSIDKRMINECGAVGGMRNDR